MRHYWKPVQRLTCNTRAEALGQNSLREMIPLSVGTEPAHLAPGDEGTKVP